MNNSTGQPVRFRPNLNQRRRNATGPSNSNQTVPADISQNCVPFSPHQNGRPTHASSHQNGQQNSQPSRRRHTPQNRPYFSDPLLLSRVSEYLRNLDRSAYINVDLMLQEFQREYAEYRRRPRVAFKNHLVKAMDVVRYDDRLLEEDDDEDSEVDVLYGDIDSGNTSANQSLAYALEGDGDVNSALEDSYLQQNTRSSVRTSDRPEQELINIVSSSSDEEKIDKEKILERMKKAEENKKKNEEVARSGKKRKADSLASSNKRFKSNLKPSQPSVSFKDIGGNEKVLKEVTKLLMHLLHPEVYRTLGVTPPRGFLLHGPPGSGKTLLANAIAGELKLPLLKVAAPELVGGLSGQSEERIRELFEQAVALAPCIVFIDEVDAITPNRETAQREMERRIVAQLLSSMDDLAEMEQGAQVLVIGATNRPDSLDPALRRAGRFDREVCLGIPNQESRKSILHTLCKTLRLDTHLNLDDVAALTPGFVGADLKGLVTEAAMSSVRRLFKSVSEKDKSDSHLKDKEVVEVEDKEVGKDNATPMQVGEENPTAEEKEESKDKPSTVGKENKEETEQKQDSDSSIEEIEKDEDKGKKSTDSEDPPKDVEVMEVEDDSVTVEKHKEEKQDEKDVVKPIDEQGGKEKTDYILDKSLLHSAPFTADQLKDVYITVDDFKTALKSVQPSAKREGFATVPDVKWEDVGSLQYAREELQMAILAPVKFQRQFANLGLKTPTGILLCGPPGCGKTLLAKAIANEAGINFISVKGPELLNMYVGESERAVRQCFQRAHSSQPCVIFFDEIDALCPKRSGMENGASRVVNQLLTEMDGVEGRTGVFLMAATNRPDIVDPAVMRPGRLDKVIYVGLPDAVDRADILRAITKNGTEPRIAADVNFRELAEDSRCAGYTGADLGALVREASIQVIREHMKTSTDPDTMNNLQACSRHFQAALDKIRPSVSHRDKERYEVLRLQYAAVPTAVEGERPPG